MTMDAKKKALLDGLNEDLAHEYSAVIMYNHYSATVGGLAGHILKPFFQGEVTDEIGHAHYLADKITTLGGTPTTEAKPVPATSDVKEMVQNALKAEEETITRYNERIQQAEEAGLVALKIELEDLMTAETKHKEEMERLLQDPLLR